MIEFIFQTALHARGELYLAAEDALIKEKSQAESFLAELPEFSNLMEQRVVELLRQRVAQNEDFARCLAFFDETEAETAPTAQGEPVPEWVAARLFQDFGPRVGLLLGVYLVKLEETWPFWKTAGALLYLERLPSSQVSIFLLEMALEGQSGQFREMARKALLAKPDAGLLALVQKRLEKTEGAATTLRQLSQDLKNRQT